jgi:hypothetical protein
MVIALSLLDRVRREPKDSAKNMVFKESWVEAVRSEQSAQASFLGRETIENAARGDLHPSLPRSASS